MNLDPGLSGERFLIQLSLLSLGLLAKIKPGIIEYENLNI